MPSSARNKLLLHAFLGACLASTVVSVPVAGAQVVPPTSGGATFVPPPPPPETAQLVDGRVIAPASAPTRVKRAITAANRLVEKPYIYGGGHKPFVKGKLDAGYDCSGAVSYALYGGRFLRSPLPSGSMMNWGDAGPGQWITVYAHSSHAYVVIAGLRFDTSMHDPDAPGPGTGPRWSRSLRESGAFVARHPRGY
jgi:hypothetical protein